MRIVVKNEMAAAISECDVLLGAVAPTAAYKFGEKLSDPLSMYVGDLMTAGVNLSGAELDSTSYLASKCFFVFVPCIDCETEVCVFCMQLSLVRTMSLQHMQPCNIWMYFYNRLLVLITFKVMHVHMDKYIFRS